MEGEEDPKSAWEREFGEWNEDNLETHGVMHYDNKPYVLLVDSHPVISLIKENAFMFNGNFDDITKLEGQFYRVSTLVLTSCCDTIRTHIFNKKNNTQSRPDVLELP
jgi:hypothetical protein